MSCVLVMMSMDSMMMEGEWVHKNRILATTSKQSRNSHTSSYHKIRRRVYMMMRFYVYKKYNKKYNTYSVILEIKTLDTKTWVELYPSRRKTRPFMAGMKGACIKFFHSLKLLISVGRHTLSTCCSRHSSCRKTLKRKSP